jgi:sugar-specific transcriptional regulator TrmB
LDEHIKQKILFEISQIDEMIDGAKPIRDLCKTKTPDIIEKSAAALLLQSFYNGIENILIIIVKHFDEKLPNGSKWHKELLEKAFEESEKHKQIFRDTIKFVLNDYMSMRHFIRHTYGFRLDWEQMQGLTNEIDAIWIIVKEDLNRFIETNS